MGACLRVTGHVDGAGQAAQGGVLGFADEKGPTHHDGSLPTAAGAQPVARVRMASSNPETSGAWAPAPSDRNRWASPRGRITRSPAASGWTPRSPGWSKPSRNGVPSPNHR